MHYHQHMYTDPVITVDVKSSVDPIPENPIFLICNISGHESLTKSVVTYEWSKMTEPIENVSSILYFSCLTLSHAGEYTCKVTIKSVDLLTNLSNSSSYALNMSCELNHLFETIT